MSTRHGNSGRGTDGAAPRLTSAQREKSAVAARGGRAGVGKDQNRSGDRGTTARPPEPKPQPGGGRPSESEKPDSPDSRWGGGR